MEAGNYLANHMHEVPMILCLLQPWNHDYHRQQTRSPQRCWWRFVYPTVQNCCWLAGMKDWLCPHNPVAMKKQL